MIRKLIKIDENRCNGCGACVTACHEGAIGLVNGKAKLLRDDYCDGLGDCLPACPMDAISFEEREALPYDEAAVKKAKEEKELSVNVPSRLQQWPVQIKLLPPNAPFYNGAHILVAADCTAFAYGNFHNDFIKDRTTLVGCPKLDALDYSQKLTQIFTNNDVASVTVARMTVPCCGGMEFAVRKAIENSGKNIPLRVVTISVEGEIVNETN